MTPERLLLGPGPSPVSARVMRAMSAPVLSHLDPEMMVILDDLRRRLDSTFGAGAGRVQPGDLRHRHVRHGSAVANITAPGARVLVVVTGYFGDRLAQIFERYGATVTRVDVEWGRACDPAAVERALAAAPADIVAVVHAETSTGVLNPVQRDCRARGARGRADGRRRGDVVRRDAARDRRVGHRRLLQLLAEGAGRAVRAGAAVVLGARRWRRRCPRAASTSIWRSSRTTGSAASITTRSPRRSSTRCAKRSPSSRRKGSSSAGRVTSATTARSPPGSTRSVSRCCRPPASVCGR